MWGPGSRSGGTGFFRSAWGTRACARGRERMARRRRCSGAASCDDSRRGRGAFGEGRGEGGGGVLVRKERGTAGGRQGGRIPADGDVGGGRWLAADLGLGLRRMEISEAARERVARELAGSEAGAAPGGCG